MEDLNKKIIENLLLEFPTLSLYGKNKLYKVVGPVVVGIDLIKRPGFDEITPYFACYPLWKVGLEECLDSPILLVKYEVNKIPFDLNKSMSSKKLLEALDDYSKKPPLSASNNSYLQAMLRVVKLYIVLSQRNKEEAESILDEIKQTNWSEEHFKMWNVDLKKWILDLEKIVLNSEEIINQIKINKENSKLNSLQKFDLQIIN